MLTNPKNKKKCNKNYFIFYIKFNNYLYFAKYFNIFMIVYEQSKALPIFKFKTC
jgi:hypothetical protein